MDTEFESDAHELQAWLLEHGPTEPSMLCFPFPGYWLAEAYPTALRAGLITEADGLAQAT